MAGQADVVVVGGMESMSLAPYVLDKARTGYNMGNATMADTMINDGLWDAFNDIHMGITAENVAAQFDISHQDQDAYSVTSQIRTEAAIKAGKLTDEIVPVTIPQRKGNPVVFGQDEFPRFGTTLESLSKLRAAFSKDGTVTAGNASGINDGAAAMAGLAIEDMDLVEANEAFAVGGPVSGHPHVWRGEPTSTLPRSLEQSEACSS